LLLSLISKNYKLLCLITNYINFLTGGHPDIPPSSHCPTIIGSDVYYSHIWYTTEVSLYQCKICIYWSLLGLEPGHGTWPHGYIWQGKQVLNTILCTAVFSIKADICVCLQKLYIVVYVYPQRIPSFLVLISVNMKHNA